MPLCGIGAVLFFHCCVGQGLSFNPNLVLAWGDLGLPAVS